MEVCDGLNMKATELRLGLPGRDSPDREEHLIRDEKSDNIFGFVKKRGFSDAIKGGGASGKWGLTVGRRYDQDNGGGADLIFSAKADVILVQPSPTSAKDKSVHIGGGTTPGGCHGFSPSSKAQVIGWPPIRSFRKNAMPSRSSKPDEDVEVKSAPPACLYVKVSMDGAPYLRKIDLKNLVCYIELSSALEKMFSCFSIGKCDGFSESHVMDLLHGSEYVLTYEDRDGDWMLVGDVPWDMFMESCRRLRIMLSSEAIGLAPRAFEKCRSRN